MNGILSNFTETILGIYVGTIPSFRKIGLLVFEIKGNMIPIFIYRDFFAIRKIKHVTK